MPNDEDDASAETDPLHSLKSPSDFAGQHLFIQGEDWHNNAMLGWTHFPCDIYAAGYKDAADALVGALAERKASLDSVVYPLVFLYRQGLELQLKLILPLARRLAGKKAIADHQHGLMPLWSELRRHVEALDPREDDKELPAIEDFIRQLDTVIPAPSRFVTPAPRRARYPCPTCDKSTCGTSRRSWTACSCCWAASILGWGRWSRATATTDGVAAQAKTRRRCTFAREAAPFADGSRCRSLDPQSRGREGFRLLEIARDEVTDADVNLLFAGGLAAQQARYPATL